MKKVELRESALGGPEELHALLARELGFPTYYGGNLSALADCLEELAAPTRITLEQDGSRRDDDSWFDRARAVIERSGIQNPTLEVVIHA